MDSVRLTLLLELEMLPEMAFECPHPLRKVKVGAHHVYAGAAKYLTEKSIASEGIELFVPLSTATVPVPTGVRVRPAVLPDFGGVTSDWSAVIDELVDELKQGTILMCCCQAGHGRTGTLLASLVSVMEPGIIDPIDTVRHRYCHHAVETTAQAEAIFALRNQKLPERYRGTFVAEGY